MLTQSDGLFAGDVPAGECYPRAGRGPHGLGDAETSPGGGQTARRRHRQPRRGSQGRHWVQGDYGLILGVVDT